MNPWIHKICFLFLGLVYAIFQTQNAMIDSWYYAACVKHHQELFNSHHLLYNFIGNYWFSLLKLVKPNIEAIFALNLMNAFAATACLFLLHSCLLKLKTEKIVALWLTLFCGVSFGFMRYASDAETYILPLAFSLLSTYFFIDQQTKRVLFFAGLFAALAILIHQLHIWWGLAMIIYLLREKPFKTANLLNFCLPLLLIPVTYLLVYITKESGPSTFIQFITGEYSKGNAALDFSLKALLLTIVNFIRTFIQLHGQIAPLFHHYQWPFTFLVCIIVFLIIAILTQKKPWFKPINRESTGDYSKLFLTAFLLHLIFAYLSSGNAEFMVILPFLMVLYFGAKYQFSNTAPLKYLTIIILMWNISIGIVPNAFLNTQKVTHQVEITRNNPNAYFLWKAKPLVENIITYQNGFNLKRNYINPKTLDTKLVDSLLNANSAIYTDIYNQQQVLNRERLLNVIELDKTSRQWHLYPADSFDNLYGRNYIYLIQRRTD